MKKYIIYNELPFTARVPSNLGEKKQTFSHCTCSKVAAAAPMQPFTKKLFKKFIRGLEWLHGGAGKVHSIFVSKSYQGLRKKSNDSRMEMMKNISLSLKILLFFIFSNEIQKSLNLIQEN